MKKWIFPLLVFFGLNLAYLSSLRSGSRDLPLEPELQRKIFLKASNSVLVLMREKADLAAVEKIQSKQEKGRFVYDSLRKVAMESQKDLVVFLESRNIKHRRFYIANMIAIHEAPAELIVEISKRNDVEKIYENPEFEVARPIIGRRIKDDGSQGTGQPEESLRQIRADQVWKDFGVRGQGIVVASQDSGVEWDHPSLIRQYRGGAGAHDYHWHDAIKEPISAKKNICGYGSLWPCDDGAHGTHTLGTVLGSDGGLNLIGVAPDAKWIACRNMDQGYGTPANYIDCFEFFLAPYPLKGNPMSDGKPELAPHIINNSWGCPLAEGCSGREMIPVLEALQLAGIFVVASAGNDGPECESVNMQPAHLSGLSFSVGAVQRDRQIAFFSSRGPSWLTGEIAPDLTAPGTNIRSSVPGKAYEGNWNGTSMAGPHVAGVVALVWSAVPEWIGKVKETMSLLRRTSAPLVGKQKCGTTLGSQVPNNTFGHGMIDAYEAVREVVPVQSQ